MLPVTLANSRRHHPAGRRARVVLCGIPAVPRGPQHLRVHSRRAAGDVDCRRWQHRDAPHLGPRRRTGRRADPQPRVPPRRGAGGRLRLARCWRRCCSGAAAGDPHTLVVVLFAIAGAVAASMLQRYVIVAGTAFGGAWTALVGAMALVGDKAAAKAASVNDVWVVYPLDPAPGRKMAADCVAGAGARRPRRSIEVRQARTS